MGYAKAIFTHAIEDAGATYRVRFIVRVRYDGIADDEWHYFGVTEAERPRSTVDPNYSDLPYFEHPYVQFPSGLADIPEDMRDLIYQVAIPSGLNREGIL